jgi:FtsP/CotA-like multicopper oxidase with cupredoxin domain
MSCVEFRIGSPVTDNSVNPATHPVFYQLPSVITPRITRNFNFDRDNGQWVINGKVCELQRTPLHREQNSAENWLWSNPRSDWQHPIHVHL